MDSRELAARRTLTAEPQRRGLAADPAVAYAAGWTLLLAVAGVCATVPAARWFAPHELALAGTSGSRRRPRRPSSGRCGS